jgi:hypothetical protein
MTPAQLQPENFSAYPPEAKRVMTSHLPLLRKLPTTYVALLMREAIYYDWRFPAERLEIDNQFNFLGKLSSDKLQQSMAGFSALRLSKELESIDWVNKPIPFSEKLSAYLWATHQIDDFRKTATEFVHQVNINSPSDEPAISRVCVVAIGQGVTANTYPVFRKLRRYGTYFTKVSPDGGCRDLLDAVCARANAHQQPYAHWYVDGGKELNCKSSAVSCISYESIKPIRMELLKYIRTAMESGVGPENLRTSLAETGPSQLGLKSDGAEGLMNRFKISLLTEGSGTQIYSTTFVQWAAREVLRRAQPLTLFARFAPRQKERSMKEMLERATAEEPDFQGSLIDADMGAYYTWINQVRLSGSDKSAFLAWFEDHQEALAIGPSLTRGKQSNETIGLNDLLKKTIAS